MRALSFSVLVLDLTRSRRKDPGLVQFLGDRGFLHKSMRDPRRAEDALRKGSVHLVLLLVGQKGVPLLSEVLRRLHDANSDVPTVVLSHRPHLEESLEVIRGRACDYLKAPCELAELEASIQAIVEEKGYLQSPEDRLQRTIGERLRETRLDRGLTLRQLATRTGLSVSLISQIELSRSQASVTTLLKLARALKLKLAELFGGF